MAAARPPKPLPMTIMRDIVCTSLRTTGYPTRPPDCRNSFELLCRAYVRATIEDVVVVLLDIIENAAVESRSSADGETAIRVEQLYTRLRFVIELAHTSKLKPHERAPGVTDASGADIRLVEAKLGKLSQRQVELA